MVLFFKCHLYIYNLIITLELSSSLVVSTQYLIYFHVEFVFMFNTYYTTYFYYI